MISIVDKNCLSLLIVDDESFQRRILRQVLRNLGFAKMKDADSGESAMTKMIQGCDLVLSDVQMPGMNGLELLRWIRIGQTPLPRDARFIVLTSFSNVEVLGAAMALDVNGFLAKPIKTGVVMEKIERALQEAFQVRARNDYESVTTHLPSLDQATRERPGSTHHVPPSATGEKTIPLVQLRPGMYVTKSVYAADGSILISAGTVLTQLFVNRLWDLSSVLTDELVHVAEFHGDDEV